MIRYIALLRGINVGGNKIIPMQDLRDLCSSLGFKDINTYIQSGNLIFSSAKGHTELESSLKNAITKQFGFDVKILIFTFEEYKRLLNSNPFTDNDEDGRNIYLTFLEKVPGDDLATHKLEALASSEESFKIIGQVVWLKFPGGRSDTKLTNNNVEKVLGLSATTRNLKTSFKLLSLGKINQK